MFAVLDEARIPSTPVWSVRFPWAVGVGFAAVPVVFTAVASAAAQLAGLGEAASALLLAAGAGVSAALGLRVMASSRSSLKGYGFRRARDVRGALWFLPAVLTIGIAAVSQGVTVSGSTLLAYALLGGAVALNEEVWFRGLILSVLRGRSLRAGVIGTSVLFGVLHLANLAGGEPPAQAALQVVFAALFGLVAAELTVLTGSLWPAILWHAAWDFTNFLGGDSVTGIALVGTGIACIVMSAYAVVLWGPMERNATRADV